MITPEQAVEVGVSLVLTVAGLITYYIAPRRGRGTLGFRVGPAYVSEEVWARVNREAGVALTITGVILLGASALNPPLHGFIAVAAGVLVAEVVGLTVRAKQLAERASLKAPGEEGPPTPVKTWVGWGRVAAAAIPPLATVMAAVAYAAALPEDVPIHFDVSGRPDSFVDVWTFQYVITPMFIAVSAAGLVYALATRYSLMGYRPWGRPGEAAKVISDVVTLVSYVVSYAVAVGYADMVYYATNGAHLIPTWSIVLFPVVAVARALLWAKAKDII